MSAVLVTGGAGFIGSHVCKRLAQAGFVPVTYDNLSTGFSWAVKWGPLFKGHLEDRKRLEMVCKKIPFIAVMHFAASINARKCHLEPLHYFRNNIAGTLTLLEIMQKMQIPHMIFSSTCAVYGIPNQVPLNENHSKCPINIYGETKWMGEKMVGSLNIPTTILRYFNATGADPDGELGESHDPATHLIPILIETALQKRKGFILFGKDHPTKDGTPVRDYIHVSDLAEAHVLALKYLIKTKQSLTLNLGTGKGYSVQEILTAFESQFDVKLPITISPKNPGDPPELYAKCDLAHEVLKWKPRFSDLKTIFETTWKWQTR